MKVFISWSGQLSREIGEVFRNWLPGILQAVKPYFTPDDVEKGTRWNTEIAKELEESGLGILLLTRENLASMWVMFEAGALSKQIERSRICPILFGIDNTDLQGPVVQFQATAFNKDDIYKLIQTINNTCGEQKLEDSVLDGAFNLWWPKLESEVSSILEKHKGESKEKLRSERELIEEILSLVRFAANGTSHTREPSIHPQAIEDLISHWERAYTALRDGEIGTSITELQEMRGPIEYIAGRLDVTTKDRLALRPRSRRRPEKGELEPDVEIED